MEGTRLLIVVLFAIMGTLSLAGLGALNALSNGEKWNWPKFGASLVIAVVSGAGYFGIAWAIPSTTDLVYASFAGFCWGATLQAGGNSAISLWVKLKTPPQIPNK